MEQRYFVWPQTSRRKRHATIILSKSQIRRSWAFCAATTSGSAGSKKASAIDMAAVTRTMCSGDIREAAELSKVKLWNGEAQGWEKVSAKPWVGQTNKQSQLETKLRGKMDMVTCDCCTCHKMKTKPFWNVCNWMYKVHKMYILPRVSFRKVSLRRQQENDNEVIGFHWECR